MKSIKNSDDYVIIIKVVFIIVAIACFFRVFNSPVALAIGFLFSIFFGHPFKQINHKAVSSLLKIAVIGLGFGMNLQETIKVGGEGIIITITFISFTLIIGFLIARYLKLNMKMSYLISAGTAICGGSAIAAIAPSINASEKDISVSLAVIFLLNSIALLLFPPIGHLLNLSESQFGLWAAIAIHDTSSVVGAAYIFGDEALYIATTVKLMRALWIIPLSLVSILLFKGQKKSFNLPWFILLFIIAILLNSYFSIPMFLKSTIDIGSKSILLLTLFLIGAGLSIDQIKSAGWNPISLGASLWLIVSISSLLTILFV